MRIEPRAPYRGIPYLPGDKSISHRALLFGALAQGRTTIRGLATGGDVRSTWACLEKLGSRITRVDDAVVVEGGEWREPATDLDCGNSGTSLRLLLGCLAGRGVAARLVGDESLSARPMRRVAEPLRAMGASLQLEGERFAPVTVAAGHPLHAIEYELPVASAQVKSALMLAALFASGTTCLRGRLDSRDHSERWLPHFGASLRVTADEIRICGGQGLRGAEVDVPGDPSSAAFWAAAAALGGEASFQNVLLNPTRTGFFRALRRMGATVEETVRVFRPEPSGELRVKGGPLRGIHIEEKEVASLIDELPALAVVAAFAQGVTEVRGAAELRVKETDRIEAIAENLRRMGGEIETFADGFRITGRGRLFGASLDSFGDHRIAMAFAIAASRAESASTLLGAESAAISYPEFFSLLQGER